MPIILKFNFKDGSTKEIRIPAEIWKKNHENVSKIFFFKKEVDSIDMDPWLETADVDLSNNNWPRKIQISKFQVFKDEKVSRRGNGGAENLMQRDRRNEALKNK